MASQKKSETSLSLQEIIKKRNQQINRSLERSAEPWSAHATEETNRTKGRKAGESTEKKEAETDEDVGVLTVIAKLLDGMSGYYEWSKQQAKIICWVAVSACVVGLLVIAAAVTLSALKLFTMEKEILTAIGGMITAIFGGTTLLVYRSSVKQLTYFHKSLHEDQRFLSVVDLLWQFSDKDVRDKMLSAIIRNSLKINLVVATQPEAPEEENKTDKKDEEGNNGNENSDSGDQGGENPPATPPANPPAKPPKK